MGDAGQRHSISIPRSNFAIGRFLSCCWVGPSVYGRCCASALTTSLGPSGRYWFYLLTAEDWQAKGLDEQNLWIVKWLQEWHKDDAS